MFTGTGLSQYNLYKVFFKGFFLLPCRGVADDDDDDDNDHDYDDDLIMMTMVILCYCLYGLLQLTAVSAQVNLAGNCDSLVSLELHLSMHVAYAEFYSLQQNTKLRRESK